MKLIVLISLIGLVIDVISKQIVVHNMIEYQSIPIIDSFFSITYAKNTGIAFSMLDGNVGFIVVMTIFILFLVFRYVKVNELRKRERVCYGIVLAGAIGNLIDRIVYGYVIDFFDFTIFGYSFPIFNIADIMIVVGIFLLLIFSFVEGRDNNGDNSRCKG